SPRLRPSDAQPRYHQRRLRNRGAGRHHAQDPGRLPDGQAHRQRHAATAAPRWPLCSRPGVSGPDGFAVRRLPGEVMKAALLYATTFGKTRRVVTEVTRQLEFAVDVYDVKDMSRPLDDSYDLLLWFCPTYGDEELQEDMESFLAEFHPDLSAKKFCVC